MKGETMILTRFTEGLERHKAELDDATYWRYRGGRLPRLLLWLVQRPELAAALAEDAAELARSRGSGDDTTKGGDLIS
jgi:hypothetical protein